MHSFAVVPWLQPYPDELLDELAPCGDEPDAAVVEWETISLTFLAALQAGWRAGGRSMTEPWARTRGPARNRNRPNTGVSGADAAPGLPKARDPSRPAAPQRPGRSRPDNPVPPSRLTASPASAPESAAR